MYNDITVIIYACNDENKIKSAIASAKLLTDNILVVDIGSKDKTRELAEKSGIKVLSVPFSSYVEPVRETGIKNAETDWVLILDADERITQDLVLDIKPVLANPKFSFYKIPRKEFFCGKQWLKHGGWWPNYQIRIINKRSLIEWPTAIHSTPEIEGDCGYLKYPILHFSKNDYEEIVKKTIVFEDIESQLLFKAKREVSVFILYRKFLGELFRRLIKNMGFRDGGIGIIESIYQSYSKTITYLFLYEKKKSRSL